MQKQFKAWRVGLAVLIAAGIAAAIAWQQGALEAFAPQRNVNALMIIAPYEYEGTWVFDDPRVGLEREPFVGGIPDMIDDMVADIPNAEDGFRLTFSTQPFPGHTHKLTWRRGDETGNWYYSEQYGKEGWLCPGLFQYYDEAPKKIYIMAEAK